MSPGTRRTTQAGISHSTLLRDLRTSAPFNLIGVHREGVQYGNDYLYIHCDSCRPLICGLLLKMKNADLEFSGWTPAPAVENHGVFIVPGFSIDDRYHVTGAMERCSMCGTSHG